MSDLQNLYQQIILDHSKARHGAAPQPLGSIDDIPIPNGTHLGQSHQVNTTCGDDVTLRVVVKVDPPTPEQLAISNSLPFEISGDDPRLPKLIAYVDQVQWSGDGCSISMASASVLHDLLTKLPVEDALELLGTFREVLRSRGKIEPDEEVLGDAAAFGGVSRYPARVKCAMLPWVAFEAALNEAERS
ncbi:iron-sulfur cluster assembly scaffold protein [Cryobacterium melibiosiphilum]|uniref:Iron-sulfur cluster assembly scaffold protein n=1 Tax=Cryobacterium melibiosiphilum TaxID=995039 RepID=A0A3A5MDJ9_9MICO|nr:iron-sulfur cluster assembly scaffold protein [Cryobacterium melibiosiphilum]RJT88200.1 iron-sulfur cluster assembly scaffold protein [Cryobacterium melibiosiphilum]